MKKMNRLNAIQQAMDAFKKQELADSKKLQEIKGGDGGTDGCFPPVLLPFPTTTPPYNPFDP